MIFYLVLVVIGAHFNSIIAATLENNLRQSPKIWLETEANKMLDRIDQLKPNLNKDEKALQVFLYKNALPFWDTQVMAKGLGGIEFRKANKVMQHKLEEQWKLTLVRYFLKAFPYYQKQRLILNEDVKCSSKNRCWLTTEIEIAGKKAVDLGFYVRWHANKSEAPRWRVVDLRVAGVSLLKHKRGETRAVLKSEGLTGLISVLKNKNTALLLSAINSGA